MENRWGGGREHCFVNFLFFVGALIVGVWGVVRWGRKSYVEADEIVSFSCWNFSRSNQHDTFWHVVSTGYFYLLFLWAVAVSYFLPLEIYKNLGLLLSTITFTVNSYADKHFYKYISLFQILYSMKSLFFLIKIHVKVCFIQILFKCEAPLLFFLIKTMVYRSKFFF